MRIGERIIKCWVLDCVLGPWKKQKKKRFRAQSWHEVYNTLYWTTKIAKDEKINMLFRYTLTEHYNKVNQLTPKGRSPLSNRINTESEYTAVLLLLLLLLPTIDMIIGIGNHYGRPHHRKVEQPTTYWPLLPRVRPIIYSNRRRFYWLRQNNWW